MTQVFDVRGKSSEIWTLDVVGERGPINYSGSMIVYMLKLKTLSAGGIHNYSFALDNSNWDLSLPGKYTFQFNYESSPKSSDDERGIWSGQVMSEKVIVQRN